MASDTGVYIEHDSFGVCMDGINVELMNMLLALS